jgi:pSer/pThr/pTyr-binding forkhead associated (FHA) protein
MEVKLLVLDGKNSGREIPVAGPEFLIGRGEGCHLRPSSDRVSRKHCVIRQKEGHVSIIDLNSTNHTYVNNEEVSGERELKNGDRLKVGVLEFEVQLSVSVGGKKKPKVTTIQEAAARTVQAGAAQDDDLDITDWLDDEKEGEGNEPQIEENPSVKDTRVIGDKMTDTMAVPAPHIADNKKKEKVEAKKTLKSSGHIIPTKKIAGVDTQSVADDALRHFLSRKK